MENTSSRNPLYTIAAIALILFSGVGIATMMGWLPSSHSKSQDISSASPALSAPAPAGQAQPPAPGAQPTAPGTQTTEAEGPAPAPQHRHHKEPARVAQAGSPPPGESAMPPQGAAAVPPPGSAPMPAQAPPCDSCGTVQSVQQVEQKGQGTGLGAVAGGVLGAVVGHQVGQGSGNTLATIIGAGGGALAGNAVEKNARKTLSWKVNVAMADGSVRSFSFASQPGFAAGDHVRVSNGQLVAASN